MQNLEVLVTRFERGPFLAAGVVVQAQGGEEAAQRLADEVRAVHQAPGGGVGGHDGPVGGQGQQPVGHVVEQPGVEGLQEFQAPPFLLALQEAHQQDPEDDGHGQDVTGLQDGRVLVFAEGREVLGHVHADQQQRGLVVRGALAVVAGRRGAEVADPAQDHDGLALEIHFTAPFPGVAHAFPGDGRQLVLDGPGVVVGGQEDVPQGVVEADEAGVGEFDVVLEEILGQAAVEVQHGVGLFGRGGQAQLAAQVDLDAGGDGAGRDQGVLPEGVLLLPEVAPGGEAQGQPEHEHGHGGHHDRTAGAGREGDFHACLFA